MRVSSIYRVARTAGRNAAYYRKKQPSSDARPGAKTSLFGGLASLDYHPSKAINYRPLVVGKSFATAGSWPMDLQEIY